MPISLPRLQRINLGEAVAETVLERDSLFQLNVLLWSCLEQPSGAPVTPALRNAGYVLWAVEQPLDAGPLELARLRQVALVVHPPSEQ